MAEGDIKPPVEAKPQTEAERAQALVTRLWNDKALGRTVRATAKEMFPDAPPTIDDQLEPLLEPFKAEVATLTEQLRAANEERANREKADSEARAEVAMRGEFEQAKSRFRLNEAGEELTLKLMHERGITSPLAAAALVVADNPPPKDFSGFLGPQNMDLYGSGQESQEERIKLLHKSPMDRFLDAEFRDFVGDPEAYMRSAGIPDWQIQASIG